MTAQIAIPGPCSTERCEVGGCLHPRVHDVHVVDALRSRNALNHEFTPHTHTPECDARFWGKVTGCVVSDRVGDDLWCGFFPLEERHAALHERTGGRLAPVYSAPEIEASWVAAKVMLAEAERRGFTVVVFVHERPNVVVSQHDGREVWEQVRFDSLDTLPAAVAAALEQAVVAALGGE